MKIERKVQEVYSTGDKRRREEQNKKRKKDNKDKEEQDFNSVIVSLTDKEESDKKEFIGYGFNAEYYRKAKMRIHKEEREEGNNE